MLSVLTINHNNSDISFLENFSFSKNDLELALNSLNKESFVEECFILSTCNRVEIYVYSKSENIESEIIQFISEFHKFKMDKSPITYQFFHEKDAIYHLIKVASGTDSMVFGEPQIINQIKQSYNAANSIGTIGLYLHKLIHISLFTAKRVRSETSVGKKGDSIGSLVVYLSKKIFDELKSKSALVLGTGEISQLIVSYLRKNGCSKIFVASKDVKNAITFSDRNSCKPVILDNIDKYLSEVDMVFTASGSDNFLITKERMESVLHLKRDKHIFIVDIAVPRDVDPRVGDLDKCFLYDLDDLKSIIHKDFGGNEKGIEEASKIIQESVDLYLSWENTNDSKEIIKALSEHVFNIVNSELSQSGDKKDLELLSKRISNKILHVPINRVKTESNIKENLYLKVLSDIFDLDQSVNNVVNLENEKKLKNRN